MGLFALYRRRPLLVPWRPMVRFTREQLRRELERVAHAPVHLTLTANASSYISFKPDETPRRLRLQRMFLSAPDEVIISLGRWIGGRERRCPKAVRRFIDYPPAEVVELAHSRRRRLQTRGRCWDLGRMLQRLNERFFGGAVTARITWGRRSSRRAVQARTLGAYYRNEQLIVIHPVLDQWVVPEWFVEFTVYHECLHTFQGPGERPHNRRFAEQLRRHPDHVAALKWEKENISLLTRGHDPGRRMAAWEVKRPPEEPPGKSQMIFQW
jgi:hypothetical protein